MCRPAFLLDKTGAIIYNDSRCESIKPKSSAADVTQKAKEINRIKNIIKSGCSAVGRRGSPRPGDETGEALR